MIGWFERLRPGARTALVFAVAALVLFATMNRQINMFDEGIVFGGAMRVLAGQVVHRDFYSCYGPAVYWQLALLFKLTGPSILAGRILGVLTAAGCIALGHAMIAGRVRGWISLGGAALLGVWFIGVGSFLYCVYPCTLLALAGALLLMRRGVNRSAALLGAGACAGQAALFRYDAGFFILIAFTAVAALPTRSWRGAFRATFLLGMGAGLVFLPFALAYVLPDPAGAWQGFKADIIDYPLNHYARMRGMPWPDLATLARQPVEVAVYLPPLFVLTALPILRAEWRALRASGDKSEDRCNGGGEVLRPVALLLAALVLALYYKGAVRVSSMHMLMAIVPGFLLAMLVFERWTQRGAMRRLLARGACAALVLAGLSGLRDQLHYFRLYPASSTWVWLVVPPSLIPGSPGERGLNAIARCRAWRGMDYALITNDNARVAWFLARHTAPTERVLAGLDRTDRYVVNSMFLNYAMNRLPATHWSQYEPGLQSRADIQRAMIGELAQGKTRWIVRDGSGRDMKEPNGSAVSSGVTLLDDYVDAHYREVGRSGRVPIWLRNDVPSPRPASGPPECRLPPPTAGSGA